MGCTSIVVRAQWHGKANACLTSWAALWRVVEWAKPMTYKMQDDKMTGIEQSKTRSARGDDEGMHGKRVLDSLVRRESDANGTQDGAQSMCRSSRLLNADLGDFSQISSRHNFFSFLRLSSSRIWVSSTDDTDHV